MVQAQGKRLMAPSVCVNVHPFLDTLREWETGFPVDCGPAWDWGAVEAVVAKGVHKSATSQESITLIEEDVAYKVKAGYAQIISWEELQRVRPTNLKVSPLAVVPQQNRQGRMILDLSYTVRRGQRRSRKRKRRHEDETIIQASVNDTTVRLAPELPIKELRNALPRILNFMATVPPEEHIYFSKMDLADGYWRMIVDLTEPYNFAYAMPTPPR
jgi:hypothetical protein